MPRNAECRDCPLHESAKSVCVWGRQTGPNPRIMVIGEAPGAQEDEQGLPFVGPSGDLNNEALAKAGLGGVPIYFTNVAKCRSIGPPKPGQIKACRHYLEEEIASVKPEFVLLYGATAWKQFGVGSITENAGKETTSPKIPGAKIMPVLHPAAILRSPEKKPAWMGDVARFGHMTKGSLLTDIDVSVYLADIPEALEGLLDTLTKADSFSFDFEANTRPWWHKQYRPYTISFAGRDPDGTLGTVVVPIFHRDHEWDPNVLSFFWARLTDIMADPSKKKTVHNAAYDVPVYYRTCAMLHGVPPCMPYVDFDTMSAAKVLDENVSVGLKYRGRADLGWPDWDIDATKEHPLDELAQYNGWDAAATYLLRELYEQRLLETPRLHKYFHQVEMPKVRGIVKVMVNGYAIDVPRLRTEWKKAITEQQEAKAKIPVDNPGSSQQVAKWLFEDLKLPVISLTPGRQPSTDEPTIRTLALDHPEVRPIVEYRQPTKKISTYYSNMAASALHSYDGLPHADYRTTSVETGRLASFFHTTPRPTFDGKSQVRPIITAPPGWVFVQCDYAQIEARIAAWAAAGKPGPGDTINGNMLRAFLERRDIYRENAAEMLNKPLATITKDERQNFGKVPVLASLYRITAKGLRSYAWNKADLALTLGEAQRALQAFHNLWPEFHLWHDREDRILRLRGYAESPIGRLRRLPAALLEDSWQNDKLIYEAVNQGINQPVQCHAWGTKVLTEDLRWVSVEHLKIGDRLLAFDECGERIAIRRGYGDGTGRAFRKWRSAVVESVEQDRADVFEVTLDDGERIYCTAEHLHLTANVATATRWTRTDRLLNGGRSRLVKVIPPPKDDLPVTEWERGYIAGMFDADGHIAFMRSKGQWLKGHSKRISIGQVDNIALSTVKDILARAGFQTATRERNRGHERWKLFYTVEILGGVSEILRFLYLFRPPRLMEKYLQNVDRLGRLHAIEYPQVVSVRPVGDYPIIRLQTNTRTYVADGLATHNSVASDITQTAMFLVHTFLPDDDVKVTGNVHDALLFWVREDVFDMTIGKVLYCMMVAHKYLRPLGLTLPDDLIQCEVTVGAWGEGREIHPEPVKVGSV